MNRNIKTVIVAALAVLAFSVTVFAQQTEYNTETDPLISLSYINEVLKPELTAIIKNQVTQEIKDQAQGTWNGLPAGDSSYEVLHLTQGQTLMAAGSCELMMTAGGAVVIITDPVNISSGIGLNDLTAAKRLLNGEALPNDHYVIIPRADGRGITVTTPDAYFMIRGEYTVA